MGLFSKSILNEGLQRLEQKNDAAFEKYFTTTELTSIYVYVNYEGERIKIQEEKYRTYITMPYSY